MEQRPSENTASGERSVGDSLFAWSFAAIGLVLLVRLAIVAFRAAGMAIGWLSEGNVLERISIDPFDMSPLSLTINLAIPAIVLALFVVSRLSASDEPPAGNGQTTPPTDAPQ